MITGYYIRGGDTWALVQMDERYREEAVVDGLSFEDAVALYWRKLEELLLEKLPRAETNAAERPRGGDIAPCRRLRQLTLKF